MKLITGIITSFLAGVLLVSCGHRSDNSSFLRDAKKDTITGRQVAGDPATPGDHEANDQAGQAGSAAGLSKITVYYFHQTIRCPSCIAIEKVTRKTLDNYFQKEEKAGRIKMLTINIDEEANKTLAEKFEVFGSSLFIVNAADGKEIRADLTGDGFKYALRKEDRFITIVKDQITEFLK